MITKQVNCAANKEVYEATNQPQCSFFGEFLWTAARAAKQASQRSLFDRNAGTFQVELESKKHEIKSQKKPSQFSSLSNK